MSRRVMNLAHMLTQNARRHGDRTGFAWGERAWTWREIDAKVSVQVQGAGPQITIVAELRDLEGSRRARVSAREVAGSQRLRRRGQQEIAALHAAAAFAFDEAFGAREPTASRGPSRRGTAAASRAECAPHGAQLFPVCRERLVRAIERVQ